MQDRPTGVSDAGLRAALEAGWQIAAAELRYVPVGAGGYHWAVGDGRGRRWFATVDDLDGKPWLGADRGAVLAGLRAAMGTAAALREAGLRFVVAPVPAAGGEVTTALGGRHALTVFPFVDGHSWRWDEDLTAAERLELAGLLAGLHQVPAHAGTPARPAALPLRALLEAALHDTGRPWDGGPYAEPARRLIAGAATRIEALLARFDALARRVIPGAELVITHGEPHPGNVMRADGALVLIDWDTVGLAPPERDLWTITGDAGSAAARHYAAAAGRPVRQDGLDLYQARWALDDICAYLADLRAPHTRSADTEQAWQTLSELVAETAE